ncbi:MAG: hypothetical protein ACLQHF_11965 [Terracidiphilus sp.]
MVGLTVVDPLADVDVKVPGVIAMLVAPVVAQLSVLLWPEVMLAGLAVKELIAGLEPPPPDRPDEPQPTSAPTASRRGISAQEPGRKELRLRKPGRLSCNNPVKSLRDL